MQGVPGSPYSPVFNGPAYDSDSPSSSQLATENDTLSTPPLLRSSLPSLTAMTDYYLSFVPLVSSPLVTMPPLSPNSDSDSWSDDLPDFLTVPRRGRRHWSEDAGRGLSVRYEVVKEKKDWSRRSLSISLERLFCNGDGDVDEGDGNSNVGSEEEESDIVGPTPHIESEQGRSWRGSRTTSKGRVIPRVGLDTFDTDFEYPFPHRRFHRHPNHVDDPTGDGQGVTFKQLLAEELLRLEAEEIMAGRPGTSSSMIAPEPSVQMVSTDQDHSFRDDEDDSEELWFENSDRHESTTSSQSDGNQRWGKFRSLSRLTRRRRMSSLTGNGGEGPDKEVAGRSSSAKGSGTDKKREQPVEVVLEDVEDIQSGCLPCSQGIRRSWSTLALRFRSRTRSRTEDADHTEDDGIPPTLKALVERPMSPEEYHSYFLNLYLNSTSSLNGSRESIDGPSS